MRLTPLALTAAIFLAGCAIPASHPQVQQASGASLGLATAPNAPPIAADWWHAFGDPQLDRIVADALAGNPTLDAGLARVRQAQAVLAGQRSATEPQVTADVNPQVARLSNRYIIPPPFGGTVRFVGTAQANLGIDLDLFGKQRAAIAQAGASVRAARFDAAAARLAIAGAVVQTYLDLARAERGTAIARSTIATRTDTLRLVDIRIRNQLASRLDREAAATLLAQAQEALVQAKGNRVLATDALAALAGRGADYPATIGPTMLNLAAALPLPTTIPADLVARRADVAAAQARVEAAAAGRQLARKAYYPDVNLMALAGLQAIGLGNFFNLDSGMAGAGAAIHLPIFESGRLRAGLEGATASLDIAIANYNDGVVGGVREAADAIARIRAIDAERVRSAQVVRGYGQTGRLNAIRVSSGLDSRLDLVDNDIRLLDAQLADANLSIDAVVARVQLVLALGGGFDPTLDTK